MDTSGILSLVDASDPRHRDVRAAVEPERFPYVVSPFVLAEVDYLAMTRWGVERQLQVLDLLVAPPFQLAAFDADDLHVARRIVARYADQSIGLADASIVVLAHRHRTRRVLTLDERHFRVLRGPGGHPFTVLPETLNA